MTKMRTHTVPLIWWSDSLNAFAIKHPYGGCFDVVRVGNTGAGVDEELSTLPNDAELMVLP